MRIVRSSSEDRLEKLRACPLFAGLPADSLRALAGVVSLRVYEPGEAVFAERDAAEGFLVPMQGTVRVCRHAVDGREQVLHILGPGEPCGEVPVFQGGRYPATALAQETLRALWVPRAGFLDLGRRQPEVLLGMLAVLSKRLRGFVDLIDDLSLTEVSARLARHLLRRLGEKDGRDRSDGKAPGGQGGQRDRGATVDTVVLESTKAVLASRLGTVAETLSRTLQRMQKDGVLRVEGKSLTVLDRPALEAIAEGGRKR